MIDAWVAPILNRLKGIERKSDSLKEEVAKDSTVAKESTNQEIKTTAQKILNKVSSGGDMSTLENMISGYINETGERYIPTLKTVNFFVGDSENSTNYTDIHSDTMYTWVATYSGTVIVGYRCYSPSSRKLGSMVVKRNDTELINTTINETNQPRETTRRYISVEKNDVITFLIKPYASVNPVSISCAFVAYDIASKSTLNIIRKIQSGVARMSDRGVVTITTSAVDARKAVVLTHGANSFLYSFDGKQLEIYGETDAMMRWTVVEFC